MLKTRKFLILFLVILSFMHLTKVPVFAETVSRDGIEVTLSTDKTSYKKGEPIEATITVKNKNEDVVKNLSLENEIRALC